MTRIAAFLSISLGVAASAAGCSSSDTPATKGAGLQGSGTDGGAAADPEPTAEDFQCIGQGTKVRGFYLRNRFGNTTAAEAVASTPAGGRYPVGTIVQLIPSEAMVKRHAGYSTATNDWEFFSLGVSATGTTIGNHGTTDVLNVFNLNCLDCHKKAEPQFDFVCEKTHGCDPLPFTDDQLALIQGADPRCTPDAGH